MGQRGINPKRWFYQLRTDIARRCPEILAGAASEQWLNAELFRTVTHSLGSGLTACPEVGKCDLLIAPIEAGRPNWDPGLAIVEVKLVYRAYPPSKLRSYIQALIQQMKKAKCEVSQSYGFLYAVYNVWTHTKVQMTFEEFKSRVRELLFDELRRHSTVELARPALETLVSERVQRVGGATVRIAVAGQYLLAR